MDDFEKWFIIYKQKINSLQQQKISAANTRIKMLNEELLKAEKDKNESMVSDIGMKIRNSENLIKRSNKIVEQMKNYKFSDVISRLEKHSRFDGAVPDPETGDLNLYTKPLKYGKLAIGRYRIVLNNKDHCYIKVVNLDYDCGTRYEHWAVSYYECCWGQWKDDVTRITNDGDLYQLFDFMVIYLSTSPDPHAYMRIPDWTAQRKKTDKDRSEKKELAQFHHLKEKTIMMKTIGIQKTKTMTPDLYRIAKYYELNNLLDYPTDIDPSVTNISPSLRDILMGTISI